MPRNRREFVSFLADHFHPLEAMCRQHVRFASDDEIVAFLRPFQDDDKSLVRLIGRMREVGVLVELAGLWAPPPFLAEFIEKLAARHALASPKVIQSWIEELERYVADLSLRIDRATGETNTFDVDAGRFLLNGVAEVFHTIIRSVQESCERIANEVADYRKVEDSGRLRGRLDRLIFLHNEYLEPIIRIVDINGEFFSVTEQISTCCSRLCVMGEAGPTGLREEARSIRQDVIALRRAVVRQAEEARRELAPLCEGAVRESKIAKGVNRAMEAIGSNQWHLLGLEQNLTIVEERDGTLFTDCSISGFLKTALETANRPPPRVSRTPPTILHLPLATGDIFDRLDGMESIEDVLGWLLDSYDDLTLEAALRLFHAVVEHRSTRMRHTDKRLDYERGRLCVNAAKWIWKGKDDGDGQSPTDDRSPSRATRRRVPVA
jgi:hypothetical protein